MRSLSHFGRVARNSFICAGALLVGVSGASYAQAPSAKTQVDSVQPVDIVLLGKLAEAQTVPPGPSGEFELLPSGHRRVASELRLPLTAEQHAELVRLGKQAQIDPATNERVIRTLADYLPEAWGLQSHDGELVDSLGRPIVNMTPGLPGWAQADVDALRDSIAHWLGVRVSQSAAGIDLTETDGIIGNYIGQAIVRGIAYEDMVELSDMNLVTGVMADSIVGYLHFYENLKFMHGMRDGTGYVPTTYPDPVVAFVLADRKSVV